MSFWFNLCVVSRPSTVCGQRKVFIDVYEPSSTVETLVNWLEGKIAMRKILWSLILIAN